MPYLWAFFEKENNMKRFFLLLAIFATGINAQAQDAGEFSIGIKAGLNFATFAGPSERSSSDTRLESNSVITRFLIAPTFRYGLTDKTGLIAEIQYSQKGGNYSYIGESYWIIEDVTADPLYFSGSRSVSLNVNNGYIDIPLMFYGNLNSNVNVYGGPYIGFLLNSTGAGQMTFDAAPRDFGSNVEIDLQPFSIQLEHNYRTDPQDSLAVIYQNIRNVNSVGLSEPFGNAQVPTETNAYHDYEEEASFLDEEGNFAKQGNFYNKFDYGLVGGIEYRFDTGLGIGLRASYGLSDITNNAYDYSKVSTVDPDNNDFTRVLREDRDRNFLLQLYIGFEL